MKPFYRAILIINVIFCFQTVAFAQLSQVDSLVTKIILTSEGDFYNSYHPNILKKIFSEKLNRRIIPEELQDKHLTNFIRKWFSPWNTHITKSFNPTLMLNGIDRFSEGYIGENKLPHKKAFLSKLKNNCNTENTLPGNLLGITISHTNARVLPTNKPFFLPEYLAGEGFPFDYLQNSAIWASTPIKILHYSRDSLWAYCRSPFCYGWIPTSDFALLNSTQVSVLMARRIYFAIKDDAIIKSGLNTQKSKIGSVFFGAEEEGKIIFFSRDQSCYAIFNDAVIDLEAISGYYDFTYSNAIDVIEEMWNKPYGWGGMYENRDCSALLRDFYQTFGIWLPRNSTQQINEYQTKEILQTEDHQKKKTDIVEKYVPFTSLVWKPGHIALLVGNYNNEPLVFQSIWGLKSKRLDKKGRLLIGGTVITSVQPDKFVANKSTDFLLNLRKINYINKF